MVDPRGSTQPLWPDQGRHVGPLDRIIAVVSIEQNDFGFARSYRLELNPELPSTGGWQIPALRFGEKGEETLTIRVTPDQGQQWIASFALEVGGVLNGVYACPGPEQLMVLAGSDGFLIRANDPSATEILPIHPTLHVIRPVGTDLLVVNSFTDASAIDSNGIRWTTDRLFVDDFESVSGPSGRIFARGTLDFVPSEPKVLELDPATGRVVGEASD